MGILRHRGASGSQPRSLSECVSPMPDAMEAFSLLSTAPPPLGYLVSPYQLPHQAAAPPLAPSGYWVTGSHLTCPIWQVLLMDPPCLMGVRPHLCPIPSLSSLALMKGQTLFCSAWWWCWWGRGGCLPSPPLPVFLAQGRLVNTVNWAGPIVGPRDRAENGWYLPASSSQAHRNRVLRH